ncbi:MAG: hypothetical protein ACR65R_11515 [Methylomicrobium sp.]
MSALTKIRQAGFSIDLVGDSFAISPASALTPNQREFLRAHKAQIIQELSAYNARIITPPPTVDDDRHYCRECLHFMNGFCAQQRIRLVDDIPRRCENFAGLPEAESRYFRFLITRPDGSQFESYSVPFRTITESRIEYPDALTLEPDKNDFYADDS